MGSRHWTQEEKNYVLWNWGHLRPDEIAKKVGRSIKQCHRVVKRAMDGDRPKIEGYKTVYRLSADTGYHTYQIMRAIRSMELDIYRPSSARNSGFWMTKSQVDRVIEHLRREEYPVSLSRAAALLKCGVPTLLKAVKDLGLIIVKGEPTEVSGKVWKISETQLNKLRDHLERPPGKTAREISMGVSVQKHAVTRAAKRLGIPYTKFRKWFIYSPEDTERLVKYFERPRMISRRSISEKVGCSTTTVDIVARELGIVPKDVVNKKVALTQAQADEIIICLHKRLGR